jgi:hypothetical protein
VRIVLVFRTVIILNLVIISGSHRLFFEIQSQERDSLFMVSKEKGKLSSEHTHTPKALKIVKK